jgi:nucleoside-diphosphate-sugar epimerase
LNIGAGAEVTINRLVRELLDLLDATVPVVYEPERPGDVRRHCASIGKAKDLIGFAPSTDLRTGLAETVAWYRSLGEPSI